jgi:membrane fusion protein (multidrug efflux system)
MSADTPTPAPSPTPPAPPPVAAKPAHRSKLKWLAGILILLVVAAVALPWISEALTTVSTDDAYINGHVTFVAPRVPGQVTRVWVEDNNRVHKGDILVQLDKEPYQVQVNIAQATVDAAQADLSATQAQVRAQEGQARSMRFNLEHAVEEVDNQIALLRSKVAALNSRKANLEKAHADFDRAVPLVKSGALAQEEFDLRKQSLEVAQAQVEEALQDVYQVRVALGLSAKPQATDDLAQVPDDLDQTFSAVRQAQFSLLQAASQLGVTDSFNKSPKQMIADFYQRDPTGDIDRIYAQILKEAPAIKQAESKLASARRNLELAQLNLRYCDVVSEIDGVVTRRNVNPGNNVIAGQSLMAVRSISEIWVDANFKETQLSQLRIGLPVDLDVDMYGSRQHFKGRISGFTMGTGSTLALLPAENATGNFVKVVQRLPVRIELLDYNPDKLPLFIGLSVTPYVHINQTPAGPSAGEVLQPYLSAQDSAPLPSSPQPATQP